MVVDLSRFNKATRAASTMKGVFIYMVSSMTGYGRFREMVNGRDITVEVRSVNHRYFEYSSRIPRIYGFLDDYLKSFVQKYVSRGKVDVSIWIENVDVKSNEVVVDKELALSYLNALNEIAAVCEVSAGASASYIARFPDVVKVTPVKENEEELWKTVEVVVSKAMDRFVDMRQREGKVLKEDILSRGKAIGAIVAEIEVMSPAIVKAHMDKIRTKMQELLESASVDEQRLLLEAAIFADKTAVDEETVRLKSHLEQLSGMMEDEEPIGRKLDFLIQEINREVNTIGSKSQDVTFAKYVVDLKAEIEKIREQVQNIE